MRQQTNSRPRRGRNSGRRPGPQRNQNFDSNGPSVRVRGNAYQVMEKYLALARDATTSGDRIAAENYYQHAEHYFRILNANTEANAASNANAGASGNGSGRDNAAKANGQHQGRPGESGSEERKPAESKADQNKPAEGKAPDPKADEDKAPNAKAPNAKADDAKAKPVKAKPGKAEDSAGADKKPAKGTEPSPAK